MMTRILVHQSGEGISTCTMVNEFSRDELSCFRNAYDKFHVEDENRVFSSREIDQLSHFLNEFSPSNETF